MDSAPLTIQAIHCRRPEFKVTAIRKFTTNQRSSMILSAGSLQLLTFQNAHGKMWRTSYVQAVHWSSQSLLSWCFLHHQSAQMNHLHMVVTQQSCWQCVVWQPCREHTANPQTHTESRGRPTQPHQVVNWVARSPSTVSKANSSISRVLNRGDKWMKWKLQGTQGKQWSMGVTVFSGCVTFTSYWRCAVGGQVPY